MKKTLLISRQFKFDAAHYLPNHPGKCKALHGHTWKVELTFKSWFDTESKEYGVDFGRIKEYSEFFEDMLDHKDLNTFMENPSAEQLAVSIWEAIDSEKLPPHSVKVWESVLFPECYVTYTGGIK